MLWTMIGAILVFFMHAGFSMVESGFTRSKNTLNILMKNFLTVAISSVLFLAVGFAFMFGDSVSGVIGKSGFFMTGREDVGFFVFQAVFAATCATIISGAVAERMKLSSYLLLTIVMTSFIYPVVGHWIWGGGWLSEMGFVDFAGSTVVHLTGAAGAFVTLLFLGPRIGKYNKGQVNVIPGHNIPIGALGVFILWFGWFGFNGGSTLAADPSLVPLVITNTFLAASAAILATAGMTQLLYKRIDPSLTLNGALAGLVGITAGCAFVSLIGSLFIGLAAGVIMVIAVRFIDVNLKMDDPVGAIAVHGICGIWGTVALGFFHIESGLFYGGDASLLIIQTLGVLAVIGWTAFAASSFLFLYTRLTSIRVSKEEEVAGLDFAEHGSNAYEFKDLLLTGESAPPQSFGEGLVHRLNNLDDRRARRSS
nr:ammonium transporter [Bacillus ectoiniformans]